MTEFDPFGFMGAVAICYFVVAHVVRGIKRGDMKSRDEYEDYPREKRRHYHISRSRYK